MEKLFILRFLRVKKKSVYKREMMSKLRSNNPIVPIVIEEIRVINKESK